MSRWLISIGLMLASCLAAAQGYPEHPIRMIVPSTPGGGTDFVGRLMASRLQTLNSWTLIVDNRPGAGTALGMAEAARAPGKGYDLVVGQSDNITLAPLLTKVTYNPVKDVIPVALVGRVPIVLLVNENARWKNIREFLDDAKSRPGAINYGSSGIGGSVHMGFEMLQQATGVKLHHIPYKGGPQAMVDLMGGQLDMAGASVTAATTLIKSGKLRALAVTSGARNAALPDVPTVAESGYPGFDLDIYYGIFAPSNTPASIVARLNNDFNRILAQDEVKSSLQAQGFFVDPLSPGDFSSLVATDIKKSKDVIAAAHIKVDQD
ncbi:Argininosuccinate lyase [Variovorax sp. SRS16]|uniref:Bug family tripartite tricarboxylate transporter substrate binding protein n=1 Tax=Variovorax sp. SRS16 TaxID=282217 RepID=UPI001318A54B|nr:tripartite tricarboxylate transporter substrate binding protein [Variovorax sp. SRS16]VTU32403.1 Argininosuccinate lyase [Variovorax sp. SRS16]